METHDFWDKYEYIVTLQCSTPGIKSEEIDRLVNGVRKGKYSSGITVTPVSENPKWFLERTNPRSPLMLWDVPQDDNVTVRQKLPQKFRVTGAVYVTTTKYLREKKALVGMAGAYTLVIPQERSIDIDN